MSSNQGLIKWTWTWSHIDCGQQTSSICRS